MTKEQLILLAEHIANGIATDEEIRIYNDLYKSFASKHSEWKSEIGNAEELKQSMQNMIRQKTSLNQPKKSGWLKWAAAASVLLILSISSYLILNRTSKKPDVLLSHVQDLRFKNDVAPGRSGAILTLSGGRQIIIDSAGNGDLAQQGNSRIIKKDGEIIYNVQGSDTATALNTMSTPNGRQYSLVLSDGSKVWLNAASSITYPVSFHGTERKVKIKGEVYFEVAHNSKSPFIVSKDDVNIIVLGTHFNVNTYGDENVNKVTLLEGSVRVENATGNTYLKPGQQAQFINNGNIRMISDANIEEVMAWKNGVFHFSNTSIETLMNQLTRWYDVEITFNQKVTEKFYAEIPRDTKLSDVLKALELTGKIKFGIEGKKIIVMP